MTLPLVDMHVHLLAGLDDGPKTMEDALEMCRILYAEGARSTVALAHQNTEYPEVTAQQIREATEHLKVALQQANIDLRVFPCAEVMVHMDLETDLRDQKLMTVADRGSYLLLELPHSQFVDMRSISQHLRQQNITPILAHAERTEEWLHEPGTIETLIELGCLVQVSSASITKPKDRRSEKALKSWIRRGVVHLLGSDGHSVNRRPPRLQAAADRIRQWAGNAVADRICSLYGTAILNGLPVKVQPPQPLSRSWFSRLWS